MLSLRDMAGALSAGGSAALIAAFKAIPLPEAERFRTRRAGAQRRMAEGNYFVSRCKAAPIKGPDHELVRSGLGAAAENSCPPPFQTGSGRRLTFKKRPAAARRLWLIAAFGGRVRGALSSSGSKGARVRTARASFPSGPSPMKRNRMAHRCGSKR